MISGAWFEAPVLALYLRRARPFASDGSIRTAALADDRMF
jgi:hypothetical protein